MPSAAPCDPGTGPNLSDDALRVVAMVDPALDREYRSSSAWGDAGLYEQWRASLAAVPDHTAVVDARGFRATYQEVDEQAACLAGHLREAGVRHGDVVDVLMPNWGEYLVVNVACLKLGAIISPTLPQHRFSELRYQVDRCRAAAMVMVTKFHSIDHAEEVERLTRDCTHLKTVLTLGDGTPDPDHFVTYEEALQHAPLEEADCTPGAGNDVAAVLFTSGSEAQPKGVMLTHNNVISSEHGFIEALGLEPGERMFMPAPIAHATGYMHGITMPIMIRGTSILLDVFSGPDAVRMVNVERATCTMGSTTIIRELLDAADEVGGFHQGLHRICCGGAPVPRSLVERSLRMGVTIHSVYGATESAPHTMTRPEDPLDRVVNTDGRAVPGTQIRIVDPVTRETLPVGTEGEAASRGPAVFIGYLGDPERTCAVRDHEGWYYSGDLAVMDADGYIRITGRIKDTIVRGGENISPREVEDLLLLHPSIRDAAVVAMPNARLGECACAFVVLRPGTAMLTLDDVRAFFAVKEVARFKTPERLVIVDSLPMTVTGKVRKVELRQQIAALIAEEGAAEPSRSQVSR